MLWRAYSRLTEHGYEHFTVNHSKEFVNQETGANTQTIESLWGKVKRQLPRGIPKDHLQSHMYEFLWRRHVKNNNLNAFDFFLDCIKDLYNPNIDL